MKHFLVSCLALLLIMVGCTWTSFHILETRTPEPPFAPPEPKYLLGDPETGGMFDALAEESVVIAVDQQVHPAAATIPECFGLVTRIALASDLLRVTAWEVVAKDQKNPPRLSTFSLGVAPEGFVTIIPMDADAVVEGLVAVNGPDHLGLGVVDPAAPMPQGDSTSCD